MPTGIKTCVMLMALAAATGTWAQPASAANGATAFVEHPTHCAVMLGGAGHENENGSGSYSQALSQALNAMADDAAASTRLLAEQCRSRTRSETRTAPASSAQDAGKGRA